LVLDPGHEIQTGAAPLRMGRARVENKKTVNRRQHIVRRRRNLERSKRARITDIPKAYLVTRDLHLRESQSL